MVEWDLGAEQESRRHPRHPPTTTQNQLRLRGHASTLHALFFALRRDRTHRHCLVGSFVMGEVKEDRVSF